MDTILKKTIKKCNRILVDNEKECQCYNKRNFPTNNLQKCSQINSKKKCKQYNLCKNVYSTFMNKNEPNYNLKSWKKPNILSSHNCYAYFLNDKIKGTQKKCQQECKKNNNCHKKKYKECSKFKPQPGYWAKSKGTKIDKTFTCSNMIKRVLYDNRSIKPTKFKKKCPKGYYKGALVVDPGNTYHFYRQDDNVRWSHKPGTLKVTNVDASNKPIYAPHLADRNYDKDNNDGINYTDFCTYMCVPRNDNIKTYAI
jgi:hypothetical protein